MNPHDLRALADAIVYRDSLAIARAADYLRAQADAQAAEIERLRKFAGRVLGEARQFMSDVDGAGGMKRTDLIALAERLKPMAQAPCFDGLDMAAIDAFLRQVAQAQPVAWRVRSRGQFKRFEPGPWRIYWSAAKPNVNAPQDCDFDPLYALPLED